MIKKTCQMLVFQSTLPRGSDFSYTDNNYIKPVFQSTLPRGSDRPEFLGSHSSMIFQSTLPRGSDFCCL